jgi:hypothetical protein
VAVEFLADEQAARYGSFHEVPSRAELERYFFPLVKVVDFGATMIVTDTASYSDIVFGLLTLAGFAYAPQLADLPDQKMWRIDRTADYGAYQEAVRGRADLARIERHWEDPADHRLHPHRRRPRVRRDPDALPRRAPRPRSATRSRTTGGSRRP